MSDGITSVSISAAGRETVRFDSVDDLEAGLNAAFGHLREREGGSDFSTSDEGPKSEPARRAPGSQMTLPLFDGLFVDEYELALGGRVSLLADLPDDAALIRAARLGKVVDLVVSARVTARPHRWKQQKSGQPLVRSSIRLEVFGVRMLDRETGEVR